MKYKAYVCVCVIYKNRNSGLLTSSKIIKIVSNEMFWLFLASQMIGKSYDNSVNSSCEVSLNISHDTSCSGKNFFFVMC